MYNLLYSFRDTHFKFFFIIFIHCSTLFLVISFCGIRCQMFKRSVLLFSESFFYHIIIKLLFFYILQLQNVIITSFWPLYIKLHVDLVDSKPGNTVNTVQPTILNYMAMQRVNFSNNQLYQFTSFVSTVKRPFSSSLPTSHTWLPEIFS